MPPKLQIVDGCFGIATLPPDSPLPDWVVGTGMWGVVAASDETTLVCHQDRIPAVVTASRDWACFRTIGPFAFDEAGVVRDLITPLSDAGLGVFVLCTFEGEHILVQTTDLPSAQEILKAQGYIFAPH